MMTSPSLVRRRAAAILGTGALALAAASCTGPETSEEVTLTVFAAASLTDVLAPVNDAFEADHPGVQVVMTNAGSSDLVTQIGQGAPADVLATADEATMERAASEDLLDGDPQIFASNRLVIAVQPGNPGNITDLPDLDDPELAVVRCAAPVPCGTVADEVLADAGVTLTPVSEENSVTDVLGKVTSGEADAGLVYATDVQRSGGKAEAIEIPEAADHATQYPAALVADAADPDLARQYLDHLQTEGSRTALEDAGFGPP